MINPFHHRVINRPSAWGALCWLVLLGLAVPAWAGPAPEPIDICGYDSKTLEDLRALVEARGLGKTLPELAPALSDDPDQVLTEWENDKEEVGQWIHNLTKIPSDYSYIRYFVDCPQAFGNQNIWHFFILENEEEVIENIYFNLFYDYDQNFALRNEKINAARYLSQKGVVSAVASLMEAHSYSREQIRQEMIAGGFWLNRSCKTAQTVTDTFVAPPFPPDNFYGLIVSYLESILFPNASITFSRPSEELLSVKPSSGKDKSACGYSQKRYEQKSVAFFLENYPESWATKILRYKKAQESGREERAQKNIAFLKFLPPVETAFDPAVIHMCTYNAESFDDLDALVQARGLGATLPELAALLSYDPANVIDDWEGYNQPLDQELQELSGVVTGRLYEFSQVCPQKFGFDDIWLFRIINNEDDRVAWIETTLFYNPDQNHTTSDQTSDPEPSLQTPATTAIDLCSYDAQSLDDLTALVQAKGLGRTLPELAALLSDDPANTLAYWDANNRPVDQEVQELSGITAGQIYRFVRSCQQEFDNQNIWSFHILENEAGRVEMIDPHLFYDRDQNFAMRREAINAQRYATPEGLIRAMTSMMEAHSYSRERLREEMLAGGFWLNGSCKTIKMLRDNFVASPPPPDSLIGLHGYRSTPWAIYPHAAVIFSRSSGEWMKAQPFPDVDHRECRFDHEAMQQRMREFFKENYPDSWIAKQNSWFNRLMIWINQLMSWIKFLIKNA